MDDACAHGCSIYVMLTDIQRAHSTSPLALPGQQASTSYRLTELERTLIKRSLDSLFSAPVDTGACTCQ